MAQAKGILVVLVVCILWVLCSAVEHNLGPWNLQRTQAEYKAWSQNETFIVGDTLRFEFEAGRHNVLALANQTAYDNCDLSSPIKTFNGPDAVIELQKPGKRFYVCGVGKHCASGMKVAVNVNGSVGALAPAPGPQSGAFQVVTPAVYMVFVLVLFVLF